MTNETMENRLSRVETKVESLEKDSGEVKRALVGDLTNTKPGVIAIQAKLLEDMYDRTMGVMPRLKTVEDIQRDERAERKGMGRVAMVIWSIMGGTLTTLVLRYIFKI